MAVAELNVYKSGVYVSRQQTRLDWDRMGCLVRKISLKLMMM